MNTNPIGARLSSEAFDTSGWTVVRLEGEEKLSKPFRFTVTVAHAGEPIALDDVIGADVAVAVMVEGLEKRRFTGMVKEIHRRVDAGGTAYLVLEIVPRFCRAQYVTNVRVHVEETARDIVEQRLSLVGLGAEDFQMRVATEADRRAITIQYRETDFDFVSRLLELDGVAYYFLHEGIGDVLVMTDSTSGFESLTERAAYRGRGERLDVFELEEIRRLVPRTYVCRDYNYRTPTLLLSSDRVVRDEGDLGGVFEYGLYAKTIDEANTIARRMSDASVAGRDEMRGASTLLGFSAGHKVELEGHPTVSGELLLTEVVHLLALEADGKTIYENRFTAIPARRMPVPARATPAPRIHGLVHAVVQTDAAGSIGKYAKIDGDGRYYVKFRFDPSAAEGDQATSCPVRMIQPSAGAGYGVHFPLRPGVEVLVAFIGGDPDRPIIVGAAPNAITPSPVTQSNSNKNRIRTASGAMIELDDGT
jgi:type VI secretion system secreted protein VgrG